jgi:hypothetical protein
MAQTNITLYSSDYGHTIRASTWCDDIADASGLKLNFKRPSDDTTMYLVASPVDGDTTTYAIEASITSGWLTGKEGVWIGQAQATFSGGVFLGEEFEMHVKASPTAAA